MDFYFGKEQTENYIEEGKYKKISKKIYNLSIILLLFSILIGMK